MLEASSARSLNVFFCCSSFAALFFPLLPFPSGRPARERERERGKREKREERRDVASLTTSRTDLGGSDDSAAHPLAWRLSLSLFFFFFFFFFICHFWEGEKKGHFPPLFKGEKKMCFRLIFGPSLRSLLDVKFTTKGRKGKASLRLVEA